ncbi:MAG: small ribosomal subunit Rsm22 family protein [Phenylobacterium sp.]
MTAELPPALRSALDQAMAGRARRDLSERAARASQAYRAGEGSAGVIRDADDALSYALTRLPATYAACEAAFAAARASAPGFSPKSLLDAGTGPGAASWAAAETWPQLARIVWLDSSAPFLTLAGQLARDAAAALREAQAQRADLAAGGPWPSADLVTASYALAEIAPERQAGVVADLWQACDGVLVLVEPGTPAGYARLLAARTQLIAAGAAILAPCPHQATCPIAAPDWCHFSVRLPRSRDHRIVKGAEAAFEDEKFAYLIAARPGVAAVPALARVLARPRIGKAGVELKLCTAEGLQVRRIARREKAALAAGRRVAWGDLWDHG